MVFRLSAVLLLCCGFVASDNACVGFWPPECTLSPSTTFFAGGTTIQTVPVGQYAYFNFTVPDPAPLFIRIVLSAVTGDPDLYICTDVTKKPSFVNFDYSSRNSSTEDSVTITAANLTAGHEFSLSVHGFRQSQYRLTYIVANDVTPLQDGVPLSDAVSAQAYQYYTFITTLDNVPLTVVLTRLSGDPDLFVNAGTAKPTMGHADYQALAFGDDVLTIPGVAGQPFTIGVYGSVSSQFAILASQNGTVNLMDGVPQAASIPYGSTEEFVFYTLGSVDAALSVQFAVTQGSLEFFISAGATPVYPSRTSYMWRGTANYASPYQLTIQTTDANYLHTAGGYYVLVHPTSSQSASTDFTLTFRSLLSVTALQDGQPVFDAVSTRQYRYYSFSVSNSTLDVTIDLTPTSGDADLFVSCSKNITGDDTGSPSKLSGHYSWASQLWGEDTIVIPHTDANSCVNTDPFGGGGTFYIAAYGFANATFAITAAVDDGLATQLFVGQPQSGAAFRGVPTLYTVKKPAESENITISVTPTNGDPDLYVTLDGSVPGPNNYAYRSAGAAGTDSITIVPSGAGCADANVTNCYCASCSISISVTSFTARSTFIITVSTGESVTTLQDGVPVSGQVSQFTYRYYSFMCSTSGASVSITLTSLTGDADLTVSLSPNPTLSNGTWVSLAQGNDMIVAHQVPAGLMYIGVFGFTNSSYSLVAHVASDNSTTQLVNGHVTFGAVDASNYMYFSFSMDDGADLTVTVTPLFGAVNLYINTCSGVPLSQCFGRRPTSSFNTWNAAGSFSGEAVTIPKTDQRACAGCWYIIGVLGVQASNFTVLASIDGSSIATALQNGVPSRAYVNQWDYAYYVFSFYDFNVDTIIAVTPFTGDPDLYVTACNEGSNASCVYQPSNTSFTWRHMAVGADTISIPFGSPGACTPIPPNPCSYYIAVHGFVASSFSVMAYIDSDSPITLLDGRPQNGMVNASEYDQYSMAIAAGSRGIDITLVPRTGDSDLYVTLNGLKPTQTSYQYRSISASGNDNIEIHATDDAFVAAGCSVGGCTLRIGVLGFRTSEYTLVATTGNVSTTLPPGIPVRDSVVQGSYDYYIFSVDVAAAFSIVVTPLSGDPDLFVSWGAGNTQPTQASHIWASQRIGVDSVTVYPTDPRSCNVSSSSCNYYIGVYGYSQNTSFIITAYVFGPAIELVDGQPQSGQVDASLTQQYVFYVNAGFGHVDVFLMPISGDADLYVSINSTSPPSPSGSDYRSLAITGPELVTVTTADAAVTSHCASIGASGGDSLCPILIGVNGFTASTYTILVSSQTAADLSNGVPLYDTVAHGQYKYYVFQNDNPATELIFDVTPFSGDPDIYVSAVVTQPTSSNYTWSSMRVGRDVIHILVGDPGYCSPTPCNYYIGVTSFTSNASFSIVATQRAFSVITLSSGNPQNGQVGFLDSVEYVFYAPPNFGQLQVTLSPVFGDPDLYISVNSTVPPGPHASDYRAMGASGNEVINIFSTDAAVINNCGGGGTTGSSDLCPILLTVYGFTNASYSLLATLGNTSVFLADSTPLYDVVNHNDYKYYIFRTTDPTCLVKLAVTPFSGDPDLYVSVTNDQPTSANYTWASTTIGRDVVEIAPEDANYCQTSPCNYYVGVTSWSSNASYQIVATCGNSTPVVIVDGEPQVGLLGQGSTDQFVMYVPVGTHSIAVTLSPLFGDADLFVNLNDQPATPSNYQYASISGTSDDIVTVSYLDANYLSSECNPANAQGSFCMVRIGVSGFSDFTYYTLLATAGNPVLLLNGISQAGSANASAYTEYVFEVRDYKEVDIVLTPLSGDPDMYVSKTPGANISNYQWKANSMGADVVQIFPIDPNACTPPCRYYIGVTGFAGQAQYLITASTTNPLPVFLQDGRPQGGFVNQSYTKLYYFSVPANVPSFQIRVSAVYGDPDIFVRLDNVPPTASNAQYRSFSSNANDVLTISTSDALFTNCTANSPTSNGGSSCQVFIGIFGFSTSQYSITASTMGGVVRLQEGVPVSGTVNGSQYVYYTFVASNPVVYKFALSPTSGDPDMYVSNTIPQPRLGNTTWFSNGIGNELITIDPANDPRATACALPCTYYIGVSGFIRSAAYTLTASSSFSLLLDGSSLQSHAQYQTMSYFLYRASSDACDLHFELTQLQGSSQLYINAGVSGDSSTPLLPLATCSGTTCSVANWRWTSLSSFDQSSVDIPTGSDYFCASCVYAIGVLSASVNGSSFMITGTSCNAPTALTDGVALSDFVVRGAYQYYSVVVTDVSDVEIVVTPNFGDPDLYVSWNPLYPRPNSVNHTAQATSQYNDSVYIQASQLSGCLAGLPDVPCQIYVGVYGYTNASYSILAKKMCGFGCPTYLLNGVPQVASIQRGEYAYFAAFVNLPSNTPYSFTVTPTYGDPDVYVTTDRSQPSQTHFNYSSSSIGMDSITITPDSAGYCTYCTLMVGVFAFQASQFSIMFASGASPVPLRDGAPEYGTIAAGTYRYYRVSVDTGATQVTVSLSVLSGSPQTYIIAAQGQTMPNPSNAQWSSVAQGGSIVVIQSTDAGFVSPGSYLVAVGSDTTSAFFVSSHVTYGGPTPPTILTLHDGQPQTAYVNANGYAYFVFSTGSSVETPITVRVSSPTMTLYAVNDYDSGNWVATVPSVNHFYWSSTFDSASQNVMMIPAAASLNPFFTIAVFSQTSSAFTITASTAGDVIVLIPGSTLSRVPVAVNQTQRFRIDVTDTSRDLTISVSPLSGDPDVYVSRTNSLPGCYFPAGVTPSQWYPNDVCVNYTWSSSSASQDVILIRAGNPCMSPPALSGSCNPSVDWVAGSFYVGVFGYASSMFDIVVYQSGGPIQLVDGQPQNSVTSGSSPSFFSLVVPASGGSAPTIRADLAAYTTAQPPGVTTQPQGVRLFGSACSAGACSAADSKPGPTHYTWTEFVSFAQSPQSLYIGPLDPNYCNPSLGTCNYFVGVYADDRCAFQNCSVNFQIRGVIVGPGLQTIWFSEVNNTISSYSDTSSTDGTPSRYELWLGASQQAAAPLYFELDYCGGPANALPTLYLCNSSCPVPSWPSAYNNTGFAFVKNTGAGSSLSTYFPAPPDFLYAAVVTTLTASATGARGLSADVRIPVHVPWRRQLEVSQFLHMPMDDGTSATYLLRVASTSMLYKMSTGGVPRVSLTQAPAAFDGRVIMGFEATWDAVMAIGPSNSPKPLIGVAYTVYYSAASFPSSVQPLTACGLALSGAPVQTMYSGTHWIADNLQPATQYEVNVVATCNKACALASGLPATATLVDSFAYISGFVTTPDAPLPPKSSSVNVTVIVVVLVIIGVGVAAGLFIYFKRKRAARQYQYEMFEMGDVGTYATTGDVYSAME